MRVERIKKPQALSQRILWAICFLAVTPLLFLLPITHDAIWQVWIGREMLNGAGLYTDIIEVNPPLWFWIAVPLAGIGELFNIGARQLVIGFFTVGIGLSLYLSPKRYWPLLFVAMIILPLRDFGQREHFTLIASLPYAFLIAARAEGGEIRHPLMIGLFAAVGFALKPHFAIVPLALELLLWSRPRIRPETLALGLSAAAYVIAAIVFSPTYFTDVLPVVRQAYDSFRGGSTLPLLLSTFGIAAVGAIIGKRFSCIVTRVLVLTSLAFLVAVLLQNKGWPYHSIPARGFMFLAVAIEVLRRRVNPIADGLLLGAAALCFYPAGVYHNRFRAEAEQHLAGIPQGALVTVLSTNPMMAWPMVEERELIWNHSQMCLWQLNAVIFRNIADPLPALRQRVARDLAKRPDLIIVDRRPLIGTTVASVIPDGYLDDYSVKQTTPHMVSYTLKSKLAEGR